MTPPARETHPRALRLMAALRSPHSIRRFAPAIVLVGAALALSGCGAPTFGAFRGATTQGRDEFKLWVGMFIAGLVVAVMVWGLIFWAVVRYRRKDEAIPRQFHSNVPVEITYTLIPLIMVFVIFYFTVVTENEVDAVSNHPTEIIHVVGYRWGWQFTYSDGSDRAQGVVVATTAEPRKLAQPATSSEYPQLVLPENATVRINLDSRDVIHGFYIPAFNFSRYAQPGYTNTFDFTTTTAGVFPAQCSQYCGLYHSEMIFSVRVESSAAFANWMKNEQLAQQSNGGSV